MKEKEHQSSTADRMVAPVVDHLAAGFGHPALISAYSAWPYSPPSFTALARRAPSRSNPTFAITRAEATLTTKGSTSMRSSPSCENGDTSVSDPIFQNLSYLP